MNEQEQKKFEENRQKLKACNERSRARLTEILSIAEKVLVKTVHSDGYRPGQCGQDYMAFGKAIGEIRMICKHDLGGDFPDYEWMAAMMTSDHFDPNRLAQELSAKASEKPVDYPVGCCPSLGPEVFPSGADGTEPAPENRQPPIHVVRPQLLSDIGMVMDKRVKKGEDGIVTRIHYAGIRHVDANRSAQLWEIDVTKCESGSHITCWRDHERVFSGVAFFGLSHAADVAIYMMIRKIIGDTEKKHRDHFRTIRRNTAETKAIIEKELA